VQFGFDYTAPSTELQGIENRAVGIWGGGGRKKNTSMFSLTNMHPLSPILVPRSNTLVTQAGFNSFLCICSFCKAFAVCLVLIKWRERESVGERAGGEKRTF